ncbi:hypothetical protein, partial [Allorhizobium sonneratiae]|uniref:hypothetical protein n=1 Tax=Allorhizobium sonneratiae TaxID=2934936 RepID=UPI0020339EF5
TIAAPLSDGDDLPQLCPHASNSHQPGQCVMPISLDPHADRPATVPAHSRGLALSKQRGPAFAGPPLR